MFAPERIVTHPECLLTIFSLNEPGGQESLERHRTAWPRYSSVEELDREHVALIVRPGWASEQGR